MQTILLPPASRCASTHHQREPILFTQCARDSRRLLKRRQVMPRRRHINWRSRRSFQFAVFEPVRAVHWATIARGPPNGSGGCLIQITSWASPIPSGSMLRYYTYFYLKNFYILYCTSINCPYIFACDCAYSFTESQLYCQFTVRLSTSLYEYATVRVKCTVT